MGSDGDIMLLRQYAKSTAQKVFANIRDLQRLPAMGMWAGDWLADSSKLIPEVIQLLTDRCKANNSPECRVIYMMLRQLRDNMQSSHILLSLGLLEDYAVCIRRYIELLCTFLYVTGFNRFDDYLNGSLRRTPVAQIMRQLPLRYSEQAREYYQYLSGAVHPKGAEVSITVLEPDIDGSISDRELGTVAYSLVNVFHKKHTLMLQSVITPIVEMFADATSATAIAPQKDKLMAFQYLFQNQEIIEALYLVKNLRNYSQPDYFERTIANKAIYELFTRNVELRSDLQSIFFRMSMAVYMSHGKAPR